MAHIDIRKSHELDPETAQKRAEEMADDLKGRMGIEWMWKGQDIAFHSDSGPAKGVKGTFEVGDSHFRIAIDLPMLLRAMKGTIEGRVRTRLEELAKQSSG